MVEDLMTESSLTDLSQIGYRIRSEREKNGWSISEVSAYLRINEKILKAIEEGRTEEGIAPVFMRGFIRSYLRYLKLWDDSMDTPLLNTPELKQNAIKPVFQKMSKGHLLPIIILIEQMHRYTDDGRRVLANAVPTGFIAKRFFSNFPERQVRFRMFLQQFP